MPPFVALVWLLSLPQAPAPLNGSELLRKCGAPASTPSEDAFYCLGYFGGFVEGFDIAHALYATKYTPLYCLPTGADADQIRRVVIKWLEANPEKLHERRDRLTFAALATSFPCKREPQTQKE
jgi:hypothetical protein